MYHGVLASRALRRGLGSGGRLVVWTFMYHGVLASRALRRGRRGRGQMRAARDVVLRPGRVPLLRLGLDARLDLLHRREGAACLVCSGLERGGRARPACRHHEGAVDPPRLRRFRPSVRRQLRRGVHDTLVVRLLRRSRDCGRLRRRHLDMRDDPSRQGFVLDGLAPSLQTLDRRAQGVPTLRQ